MNNTLTNLIDFKQNNQHYLAMCLSFEFIENNSEVLIYGKDEPQGYQRAPEINHYNRIKDYILKDKNFIFPTSIVLAIDEEDLKYIKSKTEGKSDFSSLHLLKKKKIFRIVDGQHRLLAMRKAIDSLRDLDSNKKRKLKKVNSEKKNIEAKKKDELEKQIKIRHLQNFLFNVIILVTKKDKRSVEMEIFYDINSKSKRLKVDLIELARFNYRILEKSLNSDEINEHISIQVAYNLNEKIKNNVWSNAIKFGIHEENVLGIIGVNAFRESISGIVDCFLKVNENSEFQNYTGEKLIKYSNRASDKIADFIKEAWDTIIKKKWEYCFTIDSTNINSYDENKTVFYNSNYYIQRTMGAKSLNSILSSIVNSKVDKKISGLNKPSLNLFKILIQNSNISSDDWLVGGTFSGYSSESGFNKVSQIIKNEIEVERLFI